MPKKTVPKKKKSVFKGGGKPASMSQAEWVKRKRRAKQRTTVAAARG